MGRLAHATSRLRFSKSTRDGITGTVELFHSALVRLFPKHTEVPPTAYRQSQQHETATAAEHLKRWNVTLDAGTHPELALAELVVGKIFVPLSQKNPLRSHWLHVLRFSGFADATGASPVEVALSYDSGQPAQLPGRKDKQLMPHEKPSIKLVASVPPIGSIKRNVQSFGVGSAFVDSIRLHLPWIPPAAVGSVTIEETLTDEPDVVSFNISGKRSTGSLSSWPSITR